LTTGFDSIEIYMGQFGFTASIPYLYYVGKFKNFLGSSVSDYSKPAGFLMKMMAAPGTYSDDTCGTYSITTFVSDAISTNYLITSDPTKISVKISATGSDKFSMDSGS
jgi:hypothetical protein